MRIIGITEKLVGIDFAGFMEVMPGYNIKVFRFPFNVLSDPEVLKYVINEVINQYFDCDVLVFDKIPKESFAWLSEDSRFTSLVSVGEKNEFARYSVMTSDLELLKQSAESILKDALRENAKEDAIWCLNNLKEALTNESVDSYLISRIVETKNALDAVLQSIKGSDATPIAHVGIDKSTGRMGFFIHK